MALCIVASLAERGMIGYDRAEDIPGAATTFSPAESCGNLALPPRAEWGNTMEAGRRRRRWKDEHWNTAGCERRRLGYGMPHVFRHVKRTPVWYDLGRDVVSRRALYKESRD
jgi:hypothetical protein